MKKIKQLCMILIVMLSLTAVPSEIPVFGQTQTVSAAVKISKKKLTLTKGQTKVLKITGTSKKVKWSSTKKAVATVNKKGKVTAKKKGTTIIKAKIGKKTYSCKLTVKNPKKTSSKKTSSKANNTASNTNASSNETVSSVYLSATGTKYHRIPNCGNMNPAKAKNVSLSYAEEHGYVACDTCF